MVELYSGFFSMLRLAKDLYDNELLERAPRLLQGLTLDEDSFYELAYDTINAIFENTFQDYNEERVMDVYVFCDPLIDRFCHLCWQYEQRGHLTEEENPYRKEIAQIIRSGFEFGGYDYNFDWRLSASDRGRRRLLFFHGPEFYYLEDLPEGLLEIREGFQALNFELEKALKGLTEEDAMEKEAA